MRNGREERVVKNALVGDAVARDEPRAVDHENEGQFLNGDIVGELIVGALSKGRIQKNDGLHSAYGKSARKGDGVLLGDPHVEEALGEFPRKCRKPRAVTHGGGDGADVRVTLSHFTDEPADLGGVVIGRVRRNSFLRIEGACGVISVGHFLGKGIAAPFLCDDMDDTAGVLGFCLLEDDIQLFKMMAVDGAEIDQPQILENIIHDEGALQRVLDLFACAQERIADEWRFFQKLFRLLFEAIIALARADA